VQISNCQHLGPFSPTQVNSYSNHQLAYFAIQLTCVISQRQ